MVATQESRNDEFKRMREELADVLLRHGGYFMVQDGRLLLSLGDGGPVDEIDASGARGEVAPNQMRGRSYSDAEAAHALRDGYSLPDVPD